MPRITAVEEQKHDAERVNVFLDQRFAFGISRIVAAAHQLQPGRELTQDDIDALQADESVERALNAALGFISFRQRSRREIEDYFRRKKVEPAVATAVLERLERLGLVDDHEFARFWVENRQSFRPRGMRALRVELRQKGLESEVIDQALEDFGDEEPIALDVGRKKLRTYGRLDDAQFLRKMVEFLQRRGFPYSVSSAVAHRLSTERDQPNDMAENDLS
jgi:regulatory protein